MKYLSLVLLAFIFSGCTSGKYLGPPPVLEKNLEKHLSECRNIEFKNNHIIFVIPNGNDSTRFNLNYNWVIFFEKGSDEYIYFECNNWKIITNWGNKYRRDEMYDKLISFIFHEFSPER